MFLIISISNVSILFSVLFKSIFLFLEVFQLSLYRQRTLDIKSINYTTIRFRKGVNKNK